MYAVRKMIHTLEGLCEGAKGSLTIQALEENHQAVIGFQYTGTGISRKMEKRMFEPFVTIQRENQGIGLILAISPKIVNEHGGEKEVQSKESKQTAIMLYFPSGIRKTSPVKLKKVRSIIYVKKSIKSFCLFLII